MTTWRSFAYKSCDEEARQDGADDDYCYTMWQPRVADVSLDMILVQLRQKASCLLNQLAGMETQIAQLQATLMLLWPGYSAPLLRYQLAGRDIQIAQLAATVPSPGLGDSTHLYAAPPGLERGNITPHTTPLLIDRRKVINKKINLAKSSNMLAAKCVASGKGGPVKRESTNYLGRPSIYEQAEYGPNDSGSASSSSDNDTCTVCGEEPSLHACHSGCGRFCQVCYKAHLEDGRHWLV